MKRGYADSAFGQVHYVVGGSGSPVVLIGPSKRSSLVFADLSGLLASRYRVLCPDTLGFGNSDPLPAGATIEMLAEATLACLDATGIDRAHFYGLHTGNKIATAIAANAPSRVEKLVLAGHTHSLIPDNARRNATIGDLVKAFLTAAPGDEAERTLRDWSALHRRISEVWWDGEIFAKARTAAEVALARRVIVDYLLSADSTTGLYELNFRYDLKGGMEKVRAPTLVLEIATPDEDRDYGRQADAVCKLIDGAVSATIHEPGGHTHTLERRARDVARILTEFFG